jgi:hypothetical protein
MSLEDSAHQSVRVNPIDRSMMMEFDTEMTLARRGTPLYGTGN